VAAGVLGDLTDLANDPEYGFGVDKTYAAVREEICVDGRQYTFPCNVTGWPLVVNRGLLEREGLPLPRYDWNWDEFLAWCKAVRKVDEKGRATRFAIMPFGAEHLWAGNGASIFNETMTRCVLDEPAAIEATRFYFDLMFTHRVMPTPVDEVAATEGGWGSRIKWLGNEQAVAHQVGRWCLVTLRKDYKGFKADVALLPHKVMPMQPVTSRSAGINAAAANPRLIARFQQYLASAAYNNLIVHDADALPPNAALIDPAREPFNTAFFRPPEYPDEWGRDYSIHDKFRRAVTDHGVGREYSPFILPPIVDREVRHWQEGIANKVLSVDEGMRKLTEKINRELKRAVQRDPTLQEKYDRALALQERIDRRKAAGEPVPLEWIANPVIRRLREAGK
ncbi:MAG: ABC transporter substrate-binding protein, partial [Planctomycetota bacterium]